MGIKQHLRGNAVAYVALFAALGGTSWAAATQSGPKRVRACVKAHGRVLYLPAEGHSCKRGEAALTWDVVGPAGAQGIPGSQGIRGPQGPPGTDASLPAPEAWHRVGDPGQPGYQGAWATYPHTQSEATAAGFSQWNPSAPPASFYKDALGVVHLRGQVYTPSTNSGFVIFTLPPGYCPDLPFDENRLIAGSPGAGLRSPTVDSPASPGEGCTVVSDLVNPPYFQSLDGIAFRAG